VSVGSSHVEVAPEEVRHRQDSVAGQARCDASASPAPVEKQPGAQAGAGIRVSDLQRLAPHFRAPALGLRDSGEVWL
jgi:hypothetical protein